jgi:hypothetical protein
MALLLRYGFVIILWLTTPNENKVSKSEIRLMNEVKKDINGKEASTKELFDFAPRVAKELHLALFASAFYWKNIGSKNENISQYADKDDVLTVSKEINGYVTTPYGYDERVKYTNELKKIMKYDDCVKKKNKLLFFIIIIFFSFNTKDNTFIVSKYNNKKNTLIRFQSIKKPLKLEVNFKDFGIIEIPDDSIDWDKIEPDSLMIVNLSFKKYFKKDYKFKIELVATRIPFIFKIKKEKNNNITFLIIHQFNTVWSDSLIFTKKNNQYKLNRSFLTEFTNQDIDYICSQKIIRKNDFIEFKNNNNYIKRKRY